MKQVLIVIVFLMTILYIGKRNQYNKLKNDLIISQKKIDSLEAVVYPLEIELNRYEITLEKVMEKDSTCGILFETTMSMETE